MIKFSAASAKSAAEGNYFPSKRQRCFMPSLYCSSPTVFRELLVIMKVVVQRGRRQSVVGKTTGFCSGGDLAYCCNGS